MTGPDEQHAAYVLRLADDAMILAQRTAEWIAAAPQLEEDVALANIGLDLLGQARSLYTHAGQVDGSRRTEDAFAYFRDERDYTNVQLVELPSDDFGFSMARLLIFSAYACELYARLSRSTDPQLAAIAAKAVKEVDYHRDHATQWVLRLGDGTPESHDRMRRGMERAWPYLPELFETDELVADLVERGIAVDPASLREPVEALLRSVVNRATLDLPRTTVTYAGGRRGIHTEHLGYLLAEMQHLARSHPAATW